MDAGKRAHRTLRQASRASKRGFRQSRPCDMPRLQQGRQAACHAGAFRQLQGTEDTHRPPSATGHSGQGDSIAYRNVLHVRAGVPHRMAARGLRHARPQVCQHYLLRNDDRHGRLYLQLYETGNFLHYLPTAHQEDRQGQDIPQRIQQLQLMGHQAKRLPHEPEAERLRGPACLILHHHATGHEGLPLHQGRRRRTRQRAFEN